MTVWEELNRFFTALLKKKKEEEKGEIILDRQST